MKKGFVLIFLSFFILGIMLSSPIIFADEDDDSEKESSNSGSGSSGSFSNGEDKSGSGSNGENRIREEIKREFRTDDGRRVKIERKIEIENGNVKIRIKRTIIDAEGNEIEVKLIIERDEDGIRKKIKIEGIEGLEVNTELEIDDEFEGNESELVVITSNGKRTKIKIMPDRVVELALERLKALNFTIELKEIKDNNKLRVIYSIEANKTGRFLGIFKLKLKLEGQIDPETGEFIRINKPWWAFLVTGEDSDQVGKKITLCHIPKGDPSAAKTISVGAPAVKAHVGRHGGDTLGPCLGSSGGNGNETGEDTEAPKWFDNSTDSTVNGTLIKHSVRWTDNTNLSGYIFSFDNGTGTFVDDSFVEMTGTNNLSVVSKVVNSTVGTTIRWKVQVNDASGNINVTKVFSYTTTSVSDTIPPTITINSPTNSTFTTGDIDYNITVNEALTNALVSIDGGANMTMTNDSTTNYFNLSGNHPTLSEGSHNITFYAKDTAGNENFNTIFFTVNTTNSS